VTPRPDTPLPCGILVLDKPTGPTSRDVVNVVQRLLPRGTRVGHAGTLDPLASGLLIVCVGPATRLIELIQAHPKTYEARVRLGVRSDTDDAEGTLTAVTGAAVPDRAEIDAALGPMVGVVEQVPPRYSAIKLGGRRAYDLARAGEEVALRPRRVRIDRIAVTGYAWPELDLEIDCGSGTYIRSIARDLGERLGCGGLIQTLRRTRNGPYRVADAVDPASLDRAGLGGQLRAAAEAVAGMETVTLDAAQAARVAQGQALELGRLGVSPSSGELALLDAAGELVALAWLEPGGTRIEPRRVFAQASGPSVRARLPDDRAG
jgi:tRNA pseudouridine55 synthase